MISASEETSEEIISLTISLDDKEGFKRLDHYLASKLNSLSRSTIKRLFETENISSPNGKLELKKMPSVGTIIEVEIPPPIPTDLIAENIPLEILFEDPYLIVINKPAGLVVHPAPGNYTGTLVNAILFHCPDLRGIGAEKRPGIVHRLDKGTSGVMVIAKEQQAHEGLVTLFSTHDITRKYEALTLGSPKDLSGKIETTIGRHPTNRLKMAANVSQGKKAITHYKTLKNFTHSAHVELKLETGRTHQIRVHLSQILHTPILCDPLYGNEQFIKKIPEQFAEVIKDYPHQLLHAKELGFIHPITKEKLHFQTPPPEIFQALLKSLSQV
jgi:23S rRNA pseudouridine1911/1915/1917 synthase